MNYYYAIYKINCQFVIVVETITCISRTLKFNEDDFGQLQQAAFGKFKKLKNESGFL